jgi:hypothetical protein
MASLVSIILTIPAGTQLPAIESGNWYSFFTTVLPYLTGFGLAWKCVDKVFEHLGKRSKEQMIEVVKGYITPLLDEMREERKHDNIEVNRKLKNIQDK